MNELATVRALEFEKTYNELLRTAARLDRLRRLERGSVEAHATAAMYAVRFAATILYPTVPAAQPPRFPHGPERALQLAATWREVVLELGERPALQLIAGGAAPSQRTPLDK
ncbi:hypothetical protein [Streptomyces sp. NBC_00467]|uniref:hypothetical protein n=1 Tax=Streptomyces sp. NBC_00467 TaxID=2975752 RepID=UPI002E182D5F